MESLQHPEELIPPPEVCVLASEERVYGAGPNDANNTNMKRSGPNDANLYANDPNVAR